MQREELKGPLLSLELPTDFPRTPKQTFQGKTCQYTIDAEFTSLIREFSKENSTYLSTLFMAVFQLLLHRYTGQEKITVGMPFSGREEEYQSLIGFFINMIPIGSTFTQEKTFLSLIKELQETIVKGMAHSYPFTTLLGKLQIPLSLAYSPVFQAGFFYQNFSGIKELEGLNGQYEGLFSFEMVDEISQEGEYEIALEIFEYEKEFVLNLKYDPNLYKKSTIYRFLEHYFGLFKRILQVPEESLSKCTFLTETERKTLLIDWNQTHENYPEDSCFYELFKEQVKKTPNAVAVSCDDKSLTYQELDEKSTILAKYLQIKGIGPNQLVAICVDRSLDMIVGLLAIQKSGGAYVPLDPGYPEERLSYMLEDSQARILLTQAKIKKTIEQVIKSLKNNKATKKLLVVSLDEQWQKIENAARQKELKKQVQFTDLVYVIYTSGSTGKPKGVMVTHGSLVNFLCSMRGLLKIQAKDSLLAVTTCCFDIAALELYLPLLVGAECRISPVQELKDPEKLIEIIQKH
ncbi:MAG: AMP-binding protein, partial [Planctomycetes bacterium]|nr:AMP-binding protein [Planctomycetota bacterium]